MRYLLLLLMATSVAAQGIRLTPATTNKAPDNIVTWLNTATNVPWSGTNWVDEIFMPRALAATTNGFVGPHAFTNHTDVLGGTLTSGDVLGWNALTSKWTNGPPIAGSGDATLAGVNVWTDTNTYMQVTVFSNTAKFYGDADFYGASGTTTVSNLTVTGTMTATNATFNGQTNLGKVYFDGASGSWPSIGGVTGGKLKVYDTLGSIGDIDVGTITAADENGFQGDGSMITNIPATAIRNGAITNGNAGAVTLSNTVAGTAFSASALGTKTAVAFGFGGYANSGIYGRASTVFGVSLAGTPVLDIQASQMRLCANEIIGWASTDDATGTLDSAVRRDGVGTVGVRTNLLVYGSLTSSNGVVLPGTNSYIKFIPQTGLTNSIATNAGTAYLFAATNIADSAELYVQDGKGNVTLISPHGIEEAPPQLVDDDDPFPHITKEYNWYLGKVRWQNLSRGPAQQELLTRIALNSRENWRFLTGKSDLQWTNSNAFGKYTNALQKLDVMTEGARQLVVVESFNEYNTRLGLTNGNGLVKVSWTEVQARLSNEVWTAYQQLQTDYSAALTAYLAEIDAGNTNAVAPGEPGPYVPRVAEPVPAWLQKRGVQ